MPLRRRPRLVRRRRPAPLRRRRRGGKRGAVNPYGDLPFAPQLSDRQVIGSRHLYGDLPFAPEYNEELPFEELQPPLVSDGEESDDENDIYSGMRAPPAPDYEDLGDEPEDDYGGRMRRRRRRPARRARGGRVVRRRTRASPAQLAARKRFAAAARRHHGRIPRGRRL